MPSLLWNASTSRPPPQAECGLQVRPHPKPPAPLRPPRIVRLALKVAPPSLDDTSASDGGAGGGGTRGDADARPGRAVAGAGSTAVPAVWLLLEPCPCPCPCACAGRTGAHSDESHRASTTSTSAASRGQPRQIPWRRRRRGKCGGGR